MHLELGTAAARSSTVLSPQEEQWQLAERIACSRCFSRSQFLSKFLLYVCGRKLQNRVREITEQQIGVAVFGRPIGYDCGEDNIVRNYARTLRRRLDEYFETEGLDEIWRVSIPRGGYTPVFTTKESKEEEPRLALLPTDKTSTSEQDSTIDLDRKTIQQEITKPRFPALSNLLRQNYFWLGTLTSLFLLGVLALGYSSYQQLHKESPAHQLWADLFTDDRNTFLVPADSGVGILQNLTQQSIHIDKYETGDYSSNPPAKDPSMDRDLDDLRTQRYTSVTDLNVILALNRLPEFKPTHTTVRFARDLTLDDIKSSNVILLGSSHSNPWVEIFEKELNFHFLYGSQVDASYIKNERPQRGEQSIYANEWDLPTHRTYAVVALCPNLGGNGWVLLIEGLNMAGTQAAADVLFAGPFIGDFLKQVTAANHHLRPFELLVETTSLGSQPGRSRILAKRLE